jgi:hypothetical protein
MIQLEFAIVNGDIPGMVPIKTAGLTLNLDLK